MSRPDRRNALDHVVVVMFENRPFDNLLERLKEQAVKEYVGTEKYQAQRIYRAGHWRSGSRRAEAIADLEKVRERFGRDRHGSRFVRKKTDDCWERRKEGLEAKVAARLGTWAS